MEVVTAEMGLWIFLGVVGLAIAVAIRRLSKRGMQRMRRSLGPETVQDRERKREKRRDRIQEDGVAPETTAAPSKTERRGEKRAKRLEALEKQRRRDEAEAKKEPESIAEAPPEAEEPEAEEPEETGLLLQLGKTLDEGLSKTRKDGFVGKLGKLFKGREVDGDLLDEIEAVLFTADIGVRTTDRLLEGMRSALSRKELSNSDRIWEYLRKEAGAIFDGVVPSESLNTNGTQGPHVVLVIGVNGAGKTTTIGKLAHRLVASGKSVLIGAGDTFRAAATDQLGIWAKRVGAELIEGAPEADPSSVLFDAVQQATQKNVDVVLCDTAGRLHTNKNLLEELKKVRRALTKAHPGSPHEVLLVLDATTGQNAIVQAKTFGEAMDVTGFVLTKLDGTAKGGVVLGITDELKVPVCWVGIGERTEDLQKFNSNEFVNALFDVKS